MRTMKPQFKIGDEVPTPDGKMGIIVDLMEIGEYRIEGEYGEWFLYPEDIHAVFHELIAHRLVFNSMYENRRTVLARELTTQILRTVAVPAQAKAA